MKIFTHLKSNWLRYGFESLAVVVGILAAFALESWGDEQEIRDKEYIILENLRTDLVQAKQQSSYLIESEKVSKRNLILVLNNKLIDEISKLQLNPDSIFTDILWDVDMEAPVIYAYTDLKNTGDAGLITNQLIRTGLTSLDMSLYKLGKRLEDRLNVHQIRIDDIAELDLNFVRSIKPDIPGLELGTGPENDYQSLFENQKIRNLMAMKLSLTDAVLTYMQILDEEIQVLINLLDEEIKSFQTSLF